MKKTLQNICNAIFRTGFKATTRSRFGKAVVDGCIIDLLTTDPRYQNKGWQIADQIFSITRRNLINNEFWIPGVKRTASVARKYYSFIKDFASISGAHILDLGCGVLNPYGIATIYTLNGAGHVTCLDIAGYDKQRISEATHDLLIHAKLFPDEVALDASTLNLVASNTKDINYMALRLGDLSVIDQLGINHIVSDIRHVDTLTKPQLYNVIFSHTVLEHFFHTEECIKSLAHLSAPNAIHYHYIDFCDHRAYTRPDKFHNWSYLMEPKHVLDPLINKLRPSEYRKLLERCGLEILVWDLEFDAMPNHILDNVHADWRSLDSNDIRATRVNCVCKYNPS